MHGCHARTAPHLEARADHVDEAIPDEHIRLELPVGVDHRAALSGRVGEKWQGEWARAVAAAARAAARGGGKGQGFAGGAPDIVP